jgi:hypothetical protein
MKQVNCVYTRVHAHTHFMVLHVLANFLWSKPKPNINNVLANFLWSKPKPNINNVIHFFSIQGFFIQAFSASKPQMFGFYTVLGPQFKASVYNFRIGVI